MAPASCRSTPIEQYVRDAKIDTLYEGTTAIQGQDFFFRKIVKDQAKALGFLASEIEGFINSEAGNGRLKVERELLAKALEDAQALVGLMINTLMSADESAEGGDIKNIYKVGLNTSRLLMVLGDVVCAWLLLKGAEVALEKLSGEVSASDKAFYEGKVAAAQFFAQHNLPKLTRRAGHRRGDRPLADGARRGRVLDAPAPDGRSRGRNSAIDSRLSRELRCLTRPRRECGTTPSANCRASSRCG